MTEKLFQYIWQFKLFETNIPLKTMDGEDVIVIHAGTMNTHAGPDFLDAQLKIGTTRWAGNIELHIKSSDWKKHLHQHDPSYSSLIMHVVYEQDEEINTYNNTSFPTIELKNHVNKNLVQNFEMLMEQQQFIPCAKSIHQVKELSITQQMDRMLAERLEEKTEYIKDLLHRFKNNWQEVFYIELARGFGIQINQDIFERMALQTPLQLFAKHKQQLVQIEALLFGQAGFLDDYFDEPYPLALQQEYAYLKKLYSLHPVEKHLWKFLRLRPVAFPTVRIAQFAQLLHESTHLFSKIIEANSLKELEKLFQVTASEYWQTHYTFQEKSTERTKKLGTSFIHTIIINVIIPTVFIYGKLQAKEAYCSKAIDWLKEMKVEKNSLIDQWISLGIKPTSAADSQALLQLKKKYCDKKRCLECGIGFSILKKSNQA